MKIIIMKSSIFSSLDNSEKVAYRVMSSSLFAGDSQLVKKINE